jgi:hypothetical protein
MRQKPGALPEQGAHAVRLAWWVSFFVTIALVAILGLARSAQAGAPPAGPPAAGATNPADQVEESEEEGEELETCEEAEEEGEECAEEAAREAPEACLLRSAEATVSVVPADDAITVAVRYTTFSPATVNVRYSLHGGEGSLNVGGDNRRFSHKGVFRETEKLSPTEMAKAEAATEFDVRVHAVNAPGFCNRLFDRELTVRHSAHGRSSWTESTASPRRRSRLGARCATRPGRQRLRQPGAGLGQVRRFDLVA